MIKRALFGLLGAVALSTALGQAQASDDRKVILGTNNWAENVAVANMWKLLLDTRGYDVELKSIGKSVLFAGLATRDIDVTLELWLPTTDAPFLAPYDDDIEVHDIWYRGTGLGLVVPSYVDIDSIADLKGREDEFAYKGRPTVLGIDAGSAIAALTDDAIDRYELDMKQVNSSEPAMMSALSDAYSRQAPMLVTLWNPHWAFAQYDLKYLKDPEGVYGDNEDIYWMSRLAFGEDFPKITQVLNAWEMSDEELATLMAGIESRGDPVEGAQAWIDEHPAQIERWLTAGGL
ncbi:MULTISPECIES: glycine betaine ABC transporter substrate-binding protein [Cobetia]|uniref:Glycine betaine ABC transporter substrate-binding protein n=1 Tax=Cobetia crustatorum TaxID=553385 RepID=A0A558HNH9_9GAMM|nr:MULTISPECIES: glycine betaine ABC transporter substrate-binding protein [Cobetia]TVU70692.1 glycine betaine ABC transporter substrate-binding protein [Cobetia crustatorum]